MNDNQTPTINMNEIIHTHNILLICLDSLRLDVAQAAQAQGLIPNISRYGTWEHRHAPGNFTFPSHMALFAGFFPSPVTVVSPRARKKSWRLSWSPFVAKQGELGRVNPSHAFAFEGNNLVEGLAQEGFRTICVGGVTFFDKRSNLGKIMPAYFQESYWKPSFSTSIKEGVDHQVAFLIDKMMASCDDTKIFAYLNIASTHYPTHIYLDNAHPQETFASQMAALQYVDRPLGDLFAFAQSKRPTFVILFSDHGTCFGEDGFHFHGHSHEVVMNVPYQQFILS